jgi:hypothetical protein
MELREFAEFHTPALERDEARYNLMLGLLARLLNSAQPNPDVRLWTLGVSGQCAMQTSHRNAIVLGELDEGQCCALADETLGLHYPGAIGSDPIVFWFVQRAVERGVKFLEPIPQQIWALRQRPIYPDVGGSARVVNSGDVHLFGRWLTAFLKEAAHTIRCRRPRSWKTPPPQAITGSGSWMGNRSRWPALFAAHAVAPRSPASTRPRLCATAAMLRR